MRPVCRVCLEAIGSGTDYHARCLQALFGTRIAPTIDLEIGKLHTAALAMVGKTSLSGVQKKISVGFSVDRETLQIAAPGGRFILKPQTETFPHLPEIEHLVTRLASLVAIETAPNGLISLKDGSLAYIVRRFDRMADGRKLRQEDFCQLAQKPPKDKYEGSAELCVRLIRQFATEPLIQIQRLYRLLLFVWWTGNGDMHLKNFSLLTDPEGVTALSPAYDLVATRLLIPEDPLALPLGGKRDRLKRTDWLAFARYGGLPEKTAIRALDEFTLALPDAQHLVERSFLPDGQRAEIIGMLADRTASLR